MGAIFIASAHPNPPMPDNVSDVSLHSAAYFGLALLLVRALSGASWDGVTASTLVWALVIATLYGVTDEWHQSFVPGRTPDWNDVRADAIGAFAAAASVGAWGIIRRL